MMRNASVRMGRSMKNVRFLNVLRMTVVMENALSWLVKLINLVFVPSIKWVSKHKKDFEIAVDSMSLYTLKSIYLDNRPIKNWPTIYRLERAPK